MDTDYILTAPLFHTLHNALHTNPGYAFGDGGGLLGLLVQRWQPSMEVGVFFFQRCSYQLSRRITNTI